MYNLSVALAIGLALIVASILPTSLFIYAILRQTQGRFKNNTDFICFLLVLGQFLFCLAIGVANVSATVNPLGFGDPGLCLYQSIAIMVGTGGFFGLHASLALERLRVMVTGRAMTPFMMFGVFSTYFLAWVSTFVVQFWQERPLQLWGTGIVCYVTLDSPNPNDRIGAILIIVFSFLWMGTMTMAYGYILYAIRQATVEDTVLHNSKTVELQKTQLFRCCLILMVTLFCHLPNTLCIFIELILNDPIPNILHDLALFIETLDGLFTVIVLLYVNTHNWNAFKKYVLCVSMEEPGGNSSTRIVSPGSSKKNIGPNSIPATTTTATAS